MIKYKLFNTITKKIEIMTLKKIVRNINTDRSDEWIPYDYDDWQEGLEDFTEYKLIGVAK